jgi:hypothetical protein
MMCDAAERCSCIVDCAGLHEIATTQSNRIKAICLDCLAKGIIGVPACVWQEFEELYDDETATLAPFIKCKIRMKKNYRIGAAAIADRLNSRFSLSPYDGKTDWYAASICAIEGYTLLTVGQQLNQYQRMGCCTAVEIASWTMNLAPYP